MAAAASAILVFGSLISACNPGPTDGSGETPAEPVGEQEQPTIQPTETPAPFKSELVICLAQEPGAILGGTEFTARDFLPFLTPRAAAYGEDYTAESDLLTALPSVEDGTLRRNEDGTLTITLHYRDDLVWSDGEPFDAADALLGLSLDPPAFASAFEVLDARQVDDLTLEVTAAAGAEYPYVPAQPPLPVHVFGPEVDLATVLASGYARLVDPALGPYYVAEWAEGAHVLLAANPYYPGDEPVIGAIRFRFIPSAEQILIELQGGGCDMALENGLSLDQLAAVIEADPGPLRAYAFPGFVSEQVVFNTYIDRLGRAPLFADSRVRQAFRQAVDPAALAGMAYPGVEGLALDSWLPAGHWAYSGGETLPFDLNAAGALLDQAGWQDADGDGVRESVAGVEGEYACQRGAWTIEPGTPLAPTLLIPAGGPVRQQVADTMRANLAQIGVDLRVQAVEPGTLFAPGGPLVQRDFDLALFSALSRPDPTGINRWLGADVFRHPLDLTPVHRWELENRWLTSDQLVERLAPNNTPGPENDFQGQNYSGWCDEAADIAIVNANLSLSLPERAAAYAAQQAIVASEVPAIPLYTRPRLAASADYVCGVAPGPFDPLTWNAASWYFDESGVCGG